MAFSVTSRHSGTSGTSAQTLATNSTTPTASSLFLVGWASETDNNATAPSQQTPTGGGYSYSLVDKAGDATAWEWNGTSGFRIAGGLYRADVSGSPSAHTVTVDSFSGTTVAFYSAVCLDITGHSSSTPVQTKINGANVAAASDTASGTITLNSTPTTSNLVIAVFGAGADGGGLPAVPTAGVGKTFTQVNAVGSLAACNVGMYYRVWDGSESTTITCSDLGQQVGNWFGIAAEIPAAADGPPPTAPSLFLIRPSIRIA